MNWIVITLVWSLCISGINDIDDPIIPNITISTVVAVDSKVTDITTGDTDVSIKLPKLILPTGKVAVPTNANNTISLKLKLHK